MTVGPMLPVVSFYQAKFVANGTFQVYAMEVRYLPNDYIGLQYRQADLTFVPRWANPVWEPLALPVSAELERLAQRVEQVVTSEMSGL